MDNHFSIFLFFLTLISGGIILENGESITNTVDGTVLINGEVAVGTGAAAGVLKSNGDHDLTLKTGNSTTSSITITDGANGNISLTPNGTGSVVIDGFSFPQSDGSSGQVLKTDGNGQLSWVTDGGSSGSGSLGHYSDTEISNLNPSVGDIVFDYTNQQLKMYVKGTSNDATLGIHQTNNGYWSSRNLVNGVYYYTGTTTEDVWIRDLGVNENDMNDNEFSWTIYIDSDLSRNNGLGDEIAYDKLIPSGSNIHIKVTGGTNNQWIHLYNDEPNNFDFLNIDNSSTYYSIYIKYRTASNKWITIKDDL